MKLPVVWIAAAFASGIVIERARPAELVLWATSTAIAILAGLILLQRKRVATAWVFALVVWFSLGGLDARFERTAPQAGHVTRLLAEGRLDASEPLRWRGRLRSDSMRLPWGLRYEIDLDEVEVTGRPIPASGGLRVNYFRNPRDSTAPEEFHAGDRVEALVLARPVRNFQDPGAFDARAFFARQGIHLTASLRSRELLRRLGTPPLTLRHRLARLRGRLLDRVDLLFAARPEEAAVLRGMLLGDRNFVDFDLAVTFQKTAAYHVLVVAGLHVAALAMFVFWLGRRLRLSMFMTTLLTLAVLAAYLGVVQDRPPILRAGLMAAVYLSTRLLFRRVELLNTVALAALVLLAARPSSLTDPSFQLSFLAASVIAGLALPWIERSSAPYRAGLEHLGDVTRDSAYSPRVVQFRLDARATARWLSDRLPGRVSEHAASFVIAPFTAALLLWETAVLSATIQLGVLPLLALEFHRVSLAGPIANIPAVLLTGLIVPLGFLTLAVSFMWIRLGVVLAKLLGALAGTLVGAISWFSRLPRASYRIPGPPAWLLAAFFGALICLVMAARAALQRPGSPMRRWERAAAALLAALALAAATYPFAPHLQRGKLEVTVLDVGQGDSIFAAFPDGRTMLIDGGGQAGAARFGGYRTGIDVGEEVVSPYLWQRGLKKLDVVALTHAHHDHLDGLNAVLDNFRVGELWVGRDVDTPAYRRLLAHARSRGVKVEHLLRGSAFNWGDASGQVLWPADSSEAAEASNDDSLVVRLEDGQEHFLLPGDIEQRAEKELLAKGDSLSAEFLKVPHHGSRTSSIAQFLTAISPRAAVISVGEGNSFGHPSPAVIERLSGMGIRLLRTDRDGAVTAITDGRALTVSTFAESIQR